MARTKILPQIPADWMYLLDSIIPGRTSTRKTAVQLAAACIALLEIDKDVDDDAVTFKFLVQSFAEEFCRSTKLPVTKIDAYKSDILKLVCKGEIPSRWRRDYRVMMAVDRFYVKRTAGVALKPRLDAMLEEMIKFAKAADEGHRAARQRICGMA